ncbi:MAG TPA: ATP-binding cassette domain-containing protein, partial [Bacillota bacterium]|nr:ATP-binding cassette domain-containing protein [Bacillota bacterium]
MLSVERLTKKYRKHTVLQDISFTIQKGEIIGLVGENGAGKST